MADKTTKRSVKDANKAATYVKVAFFRGASLRPLPPGASKQKDVRYLDIHADDQVDEELVASWIRQASDLPGWVP